MTERAPWWKAFIPKKKTGSKETHTIEPDFDPWAPLPKDSASKTSPEQTVSSSDSKNSSLLSDDTFDDSQLESVFNEKTCRRNMNVSRSGRFKVKGKNRQSLPMNDSKGSERVGGKEDVRW